MVVTITDDFDLQKIAESGQCFRWRKLRTGGYRIPAGERCLTIKSSKEPDTYEVDCTPDEWAGFWYNYFDLRQSYAGIRTRIDKEKDPYLYAASEAGKGIRILKQDPWETLITFIISQRKRIPAIRTCVEKLCKTAKNAQENGDRRANKAINGPDAWLSFPTPRELASLSCDELTSCGLGYRMDYIAKTAHLAAEGELDFGTLKKLDDDELRQELMKLPGVGIKVASCTMLFGFHRLNLFPKDVWINRVLKEHYPEGFPYDRYSPYCGVMQQYLFYYRRQENESII